MPSATLIGSGSSAGTGNTGGILTVNVTTTPPAGSLIHLFLANYEGPDGNFPNASVSDSAVTDSKGGTYEISTSTHAVIGNSKVHIGSPSLGTAKTLGVGVPSGIRVSGSDLVAGDTITVDWEREFNVTNPETVPIYTVGLLFAFTAFGPLGIRQTNIDFANRPVYWNFCTYPSDSSSATSLNWERDLGSGYLGAPDNDARYIAAFAAYPGISGFTPSSVGTVIGEIVQPNISLAVVYEPLITSGTLIEPGGTWPSSGQMLIGNYQVQEIGEEPPPAGGIALETISFRSRG